MRYSTVVRATTGVLFVGLLVLFAIQIGRAGHETIEAVPIEEQPAPEVKVVESTPAVESRAPIIAVVVYRCGTADDAYVVLSNGYVWHFEHEDLNLALAFADRSERLDQPCKPLERSSRESVL